MSEATMKSKNIIYIAFAAFFALVAFFPMLNLDFKSDLRQVLETQPELPSQFYDEANLYLKNQVFHAAASLPPLSTPPTQQSFVLIARYTREKSSPPATLTVHELQWQKAVDELAKKLFALHQQDPITGLKVYYPFGGLKSAESLEGPIEDHPLVGLFSVISSKDTVLAPAEIMFNHILSESETTAWHSSRKSSEEILKRDDWSYFFVKGFLLTPVETVTLYREHRTTFSTHPDALLTAAQKAGDALLEDLADTGRFTYREFSRESSDDSYNILRHAGTIWSLADLHHHFSRVSKNPRTKYFEAWNRGIQYLLTHIKPCSNHDTRLCVIEGNEIKIGGAALAILALTAMEESTVELKEVPPIDEEMKAVIAPYRQKAEALGEWLLSELKDDGTFKAHKYLADSYEATSFVSDYYPGEAAFALAKLHHLTADPRWHEGARKVIKAQMGTQRELPKTDVPHDHWLLYAMAAMQRDGIDPEQRDHIIYLSEVIREAQIRDQSFQEDWMGGYAEFPRSTPTAVHGGPQCSSWCVTQSWSCGHCAKQP